MIGEYLLSLYMAIVQNRQIKDMHDVLQRLKAEKIDVIEYVNDPRFRIFDAEKKRKTERRIDLTDPEQHRYMTEKSLNNSLKFMEEYKFWLDKAEDLYNVDREYVAALLNIESYFGDNCGSTPVINGLFSHYLFTERKDLFYYYIKEFAKVVEEKGINDVFEWTGSDAGASTPAQLMPDNVRKYGIDFNNNGYYFDDIIDGIGSCTFLLKVYGFDTDKRGAIYRYNKWPNFADAVELHAEALKSIIKELKSNTAYTDL